jgi:hypothetical protein
MRRDPGPRRAEGRLFSWTLCPGYFYFRWILVSWFVFSMFSGSTYKITLFRPFIFKMFSGSASFHFRALGRHKVALNIVL